MPYLEIEEFAEQRRKQKGQSLKILTPNKMLSRLPISLAQLKLKTAIVYFGSFKKINHNNL